MSKKNHRVLYKTYIINEKVQVAVDTSYYGERWDTKVFPCTEKEEIFTYDECGESISTTVEEAIKKHLEIVKQWQNPTKEMLGKYYSSIFRELECICRSTRPYNWEEFAEEELRKYLLNENNRFPEWYSEVSIPEMFTSIVDAILGDF